MIDFIIIIVLAGIIGSITYYLYKAKKNGQHCIGCSSSKKCCGNCCSEHKQEH